MKIACPRCRTHLKVPDSSIGRRSRCPECEQRFVIPDPDGRGLRALAAIMFNRRAVMETQVSVSE